MYLRIAISFVLLACWARHASAQVGWEVEWHSADLTLIDTTPTAAPEGKPFFIKEVLGQVGNWLVTSDDVWNPVTCPPQLTGGVFTGLVAYDRDDATHSNPRAGRCYKGIVEFKTATPRATAADIELDITTLRTVLQRYRTQPVTTNGSGVGPLDGTGNGCNNVFPCVLKFPYYEDPADALAGVNAVPNLHWYLVVQPPKSTGEELRPQLNVNIDLRYFATRRTTGTYNQFLNTQFAELWSETSDYVFAPVAAHTLTPEKQGFYRLFGYYASKLDQLAGRRATLTRRPLDHARPMLANKNSLNPNPKVDFCQLRAAFGVSLRTYHPLRKYFGGSDATLYHVKNATPREVLSFYQTASCPFTTSDVRVLPFLSDGSLIPAGSLMPVFELRHPVSDAACFSLVDYIASGTGNANALSASCHANISTF